MSDELSEQLVKLTEWTDQQILDQIKPAIEAIKEILAPKPPEVQSAILAELLALWAGTFVVRGDLRATRAARVAALSSHIRLVEDLVSIGLVEQPE